MEIILNEKSYFDLPGISSVKSFLPRLGKYEIKDDCLEGLIYIDITYFNTNLEDIFITKEINFTFLIKEGLSVEDLKINEMNLEVIENQGLNCIYELKLLLTEIIVVKRDKEEVMNEEKYEKTENIELIETEKIEKNKIEIIETKSNDKEESFLNTFLKLDDTISYLKMIHIKSEEDFNKISEDYKVSINDLYKGYDSKNKIVLIKVNERV